MSEYVSRYNPNRGSDWNYGGAKWRLSRSKIDLYQECPRCFYLDNTLGTKRPNFPPFNLNNAVDELFKKEFDQYRKAGEAHPLMTEYDIDAVPFVHDDLDSWRENFVGIDCVHTPTGLTVSGAIDDVWETPQKTLIMADYKATSKPTKIEVLGDSPWEAQYARQLSMYRWIFEQKGYTVETTAYLIYANADASLDSFDNVLQFDTTVLTVETDTSWIEPLLAEIKDCLESTSLPRIGSACEHCPYREASGKKLQAIHAQNRK